MGIQISIPLYFNYSIFCLSHLEAETPYFHWLLDESPQITSIFTLLTKISLFQKLTLTNIHISFPPVSSPSIASSAPADIVPQSEHIPVSPTHSSSPVVCGHPVPGEVWTSSQPSPPHGEYRMAVTPFPPEAPLSSLAVHCPHTSPIASHGSAVIFSSNPLVQCLYRKVTVSVIPSALAQ